MFRVWIGIGTNLGDRNKNIEFATAELIKFISDFKCSEIQETKALDRNGKEIDLPFYLNAVAVGMCDFSPRELLNELQKIEISAGRKKEEKEKYLPRTLDLDILVIENNSKIICINEDGLVIPHPRIMQRDFIINQMKSLGFNFNLLC